MLVLAEFSAVDAIRLVLLLGVIITIIDVIRSDYGVLGKIGWSFASLFILGMALWWFKYRDE